METSCGSWWWEAEQCWEINQIKEYEVFHNLGRGAKPEDDYKKI